MNTRLKSWLLAFALSCACAGAVAGLNLMLADQANLQPAWLTRFHVACAFVGALAMTRFIQGAPAALKGETAGAIVAHGVVAATRVGAVKYVVPGKSAFFSTGRCMLIICFVLCLMVQFIQAGKSVDNTGGSPAGAGSQPRRMNT
ncbi:hypothetical protein FAZ69_17200 [Trinickia terrae]|uniref:Uncharacterized protein n=2 Tax=Trinickia terrae TaxID=2571161 RepID=A0A4U1I491_9BURK|nr:hypothetical protein FAZ69_17200 [Trinickia terrae]